jgi:2,3-bisphosphoglycerate-independent phosphoglycerate mutase
VATYDLQPEMSAHALTEAVLERLKTHDDDFMIVNFANPDMVGHTGILKAAIKAVETVDECTGRLVKAIGEKGGISLVTADHGNAEREFNEETGEPHTYHTTSPVNFFMISKEGEYHNLKPRGRLSDVAPTILELFGLPTHENMTGKSLILHED